MLTNVDITAMAIPDFVAGFIFGMTGDNKLTEIEACYQGGELMAQEIETGIADIKKGGLDNDIQAGLQFALAALQIPQALSTCESMGDDLTALEQWASIFKDPTKLATKVGLHYATHKATVNADLTTLENDWDSQKYFDAGKELADLATILIGPVQTGLDASVTCGDFSLNTLEIADFLAGFVNGFTGHDDQAYLESCFQDTDSFEQAICTAVTDIRTKDNRKVIEGINVLMGQLPALEGFLAACPNASADFQVVANWGTYWKSQGSLKLYSTAYRNLTSNISTVLADVNLLEADYDAQNWYGTAQEAAELAKLALPVPSAEEFSMLGDTDCGDFKVNTTIIADYLAGFFNGFTGHDDKAAMETCFQDNQSFETDVCEFVADFRTKDNRKVMEGLEKVLGDLPELNHFMDSCPASVQADKQVIANWYSYWRGQGEMKVYQTAYKNLVGNFDQIKELANSIPAKYDAGDYYGVAVIASSIAKIALPVPAGELGNVECADFELSTTIIADYLAGFMHGFTGHDNKAAIETCFKDNESFETDVCEFVADFRTKDNRKVLEGIQKVLGDLPELNSFMSTCPAEVQSDLGVLKSWFNYWKGQGEMKVYQTAYKNVVGNFDQIKTVSKDIETKYDAHDYFGAADDAATIAKIALPVMSLGDVQTDCEQNKTADACNADSLCSWCTSGAVSDACNSVENAKALPSSIFACSNLGAEFLQ